LFYTAGSVEGVTIGNCDCVVVLMCCVINQVHISEHVEKTTPHVIG